MMIMVIAGTTFVGGVIVGAIALVCASITREDDDKSLMLPPATLAAASTRRIVGWHGATPANTIPLHRMAQSAAPRNSR